MRRVNSAQTSATLELFEHSASLAGRRSGPPESRARDHSEFINGRRSVAASWSLELDFSDARCQLRQEDAEQLEIADASCPLFVAVCLFGERA